MSVDLFFREAVVSDIPAMHRVRMSVKENVLSDPSLVKESDYAQYLSLRGKGWVCESGGNVVGFCIVDLKEKNVWALFVQPEYEGRGAGKQLHDRLLHWYFLNCYEPLQLSTSADTRAEVFYRMNGWQEIGRKENGEIIFQMEAKIRV
jgi:GNAT superfamily N-acetyltransferase